MNPTLGMRTAIMVLSYWRISSVAASYDTQDFESCKEVSGLLRWGGGTFGGVGPVPPYGIWQQRAELRSVNPIPATPFIDVIYLPMNGTIPRTQCRHGQITRFSQESERSQYNVNRLTWWMSTARGMERCQKERSTIFLLIQRTTYSQEFEQKDINPKSTSNTSSPHNDTFNAVASPKSLLMIG
uniref:Secreted protein n=1 Tax=Timema monikensis TaxID=170555 RepID=A0A7R9E6W9_9NEOP|nr:unnamed protein product [Timema monikensis]